MTGILSSWSGDQVLFNLYTPNVFINAYIIISNFYELKINYMSYLQCLTELRDKIFCTADGMILGDHSDNPDQMSQSTAKVCPGCTRLWV